MTLYTTTQARTNLFKLMEYIQVSHDPVYIVHKKNKAVLIAEDDYNAMLETLHITSVAGMKESILKASKETLENFSDKIDWDNV